MATSIYINTDLKDLTANAVANINRPTQVVRLPQIIEGEVVDVELHLVKSNGAYDARSGTAVDVAVAISAKGKAATSGTFKLNAGIESTGDLSWNASAEAVAGALNALNSGSGAYGSKVSVAKLANGSYRVIFDDVGARVDMAGQSLDLAPESTVGVSTSVVGSPAIRAQQVIEISQQPAIFSETWASAGSTWTGQLNANTARVQEMIADGAEAFFEIKVGTDVVCQVPIPILPSVAAPNSFPAHTLPDNLDAFAANPTTNGFFNPANWRDDLSLVVGEDVQAWSTNLDEVAAKMSWNNQDLTFDIATGSGGVVIQVGQEVVLLCRNTSGEVLVDGDVVKITGATGGTPNITKAIASTVDEAHKTIGVCTQIIPNNSTGFITELGKVRGLSFPNTAFDEGDLLYLSDTIPGAFTKIKPPIEVELGQVIRTGNNNGEFAVSVNNEASLYELEQELLTLIAANAIDITTNAIAIATNATDIATNATGIATNEAAIAANYAATPHNTDSVIICNQGDNIQAKYDEAAMLTPNGNPRSATNRVTLVVMNGNYGDLNAGVKFVDVFGIGMPTIGIIRQTPQDPRQSNFENLICQKIDIESFDGVIKNVTCLGSVEMVENTGIIRNCEVFNLQIETNSGTIQDLKVVGSVGFGTPFYISVRNTGTIDGVVLNQQKIAVVINSGTIRNCSAVGMLAGCANYGIIDSCESTSVSGGRSFGGTLSGGNFGTIRNCKSKSAGSFGAQVGGGVTDTCAGVAQSFAGNGSFIDWDFEGRGISGTYRDCTGGNNSFLGVNTYPFFVRTIYASFINCSAGNQSFGWVTTANATTVWNGYATNCSADEKSFCAAGAAGGTTKIEAESIIENCTAGSNSFGTFNNSTNEGFVLRCRTLGIGTTQFDATATGKVRFCLDGLMDEITLP